MREIMLNEDNLKSIALTSKARGESHKLAKWLDKVDQKLDQENEEDYDIISSGDINASTARSSAGVSYRRSIPFHMKQSAAAMRSMSRNSDSFHDPRGLSNIDHFQYTPSQREVGADGTFPPPIDYPPKISYDFLGNCSRCQKSGAKLAIVLRAPPQPTGTGDAKNLPPIGSMSKLTYPLAMGNYPEMDIIPDTIVCETCAVDMAPTATAPANVAVLPLRYYSMNRNYWIDRVDKATERRFHRSDLPPVFFGILLTKIERIATSSLVNSDLHNALRWMTDLLESDAVLQADTLQKFQSPLILSYPLDGFVAANTVLSNSGALTEEQRKPVVLLRFLYHLLENYRAYEKNNSAVQLYAAKFLILTDKPQCSQSLFEWDPWQQFCPGFKKVEELRRYLARKNIAMDRYRLSLSVADLLDTPFLSAASLADFKKLGPLFQWIEDEAGHAIAVFVHYMLRLDVGECAPDAQFKKLRERQEVEKALADPKALSVEVVRRSIEPLPAL
ncbi:hypothetical protein F5Y04DRAFT_240600 [Hypomontagnella monticulosa]|nr:hypothetical protein F5Y04DRAFT_240600 [Hypomontagnella monticulosa]